MEISGLKPILEGKNENRVDKIWNTSDLYCEGQYNWVDGSTSQTLPGFYIDNSEYDAELTFSRWSLWQLLGRASGVPIKFWDRCSLGLMRSIWREHVHDPANELRFRLDPRRSMDKRVFDGDDGPVHVRAVLSMTYGVIDDLTLFPIVAKVLEEMKVTTYNVFQHNEDISRLIVMFPDLQRDHEGRTYQAGLAVTNSEIGRSAIYIEPIVRTNGLDMWNRWALDHQNVRTRIIHRGVITEENVIEKVKKAKEVAQVGLIQAAEAWNNRIDGKKAIELFKLAEPPTRLLDIIMDEWEEEERLVRAAAAQRILELAQSLPLFERQGLETTAGRMIGLFDSYQSRMDEIMKEIENE